DNAALLRAGEFLLSLQTNGELVIAQRSGQKFVPVKSYQVASTPTWAHPAIFDKKILIKDKTHLTLFTFE
ncbi:MAG: hypothetical protein ACE5HS_11690, partial [bacterium]